MIRNQSARDLEAEIRGRAESKPVLAALYAAAEASPDPFELELTNAGLELHACNPMPAGTINRARLKISSPPSGNTLVFFFKRSLVPYSRDRYSYGGIEMRTPQADPQQIASWLAFLTSGFHPDQRPPSLRRAFPFEIPE
jgi:hypothetical protein